jgi:hypothetical protein
MTAAGSGQDRPAPPHAHPLRRASALRRGSRASGSAQWLPAGRATSPPALRMPWRRNARRAASCAAAHALARGRGAGEGR